jgi:hypothetical protein
VSILELPIIPRDRAIRQCLWPLIRFARHRPTGRTGLVVGRRRAARHGWDLLIAWGRGAGRDWLPCTELKLDEAGDRAAFATIEGGRG